MGSVVAGITREQIAARVDDVRARMGAAAARAGRAHEAVRLVAVSKTKPAWMVVAAADAGVTDFGENYVQDALAKQDEIDRKDIHWHFIGHLQRNKVKHVVGRFDLLHSLDSVRLADALESRAEAIDASVRALIEVNLAEETSKTGVAPADLVALLTHCRGLTRVHIAGLMTMPPPVDDPEDARPLFRRLAQIAAEHGLEELSMGMTHDFEVAIEEGATMVRVGTALFGPREPR